MNRKILLTEDGSHTIIIEESGVTYHSKHGAIQESRHVYIETGLQYILDHFQFSPDEPLRIFEMGLGTALNAWLTLKETTEQNIPVFYSAVEQHPINAAEAVGLNYTGYTTDQPLTSAFALLHSSPFLLSVSMSPLFTLYKVHDDLRNLTFTKPFHLIYFDAFAPDAQPELWTTDVFARLYAALYEGGVLVTYCSKTVVRRTLEAVGFTVEKRKGPPGKREIIRAIKPDGNLFR